MSPQIALRASARLLLGLSLVVAALPLTSGDAEAGRFRGAAIGAGGAAVRHYNRNSAEKDSEADAASEDATAPADGAARAQSIVKAKPAQISKPKDAEVPGCSPGMICTVCLAGCSGGVNMIVHAVPKQK